MSDCSFFMLFAFIAGKNKTVGFSGGDRSD
jgi:hypothetical protein